MTFDSLFERAYAPYSGVKHGCVVISKDGRFFPGVNIENLSYPLSVSHIQTAVFSCMAAGYSPQKLVLPKNPMNRDLISFWETELHLSIHVDADMQFEPENIITGEPSDMYAYLQKICKKAVIPNSSFPVSCLLETDLGWVEGVNIEVSNWELGLCAERVAVTRAIANGCKEFRSIHILAPKSDYVSPCGGCRQVLAEHLVQKRVHLYQNEYEVMSVSTSDLLPFHFRGEALKKS